MGATLTAAEVRAIRMGLGVTSEWVAGHLGTQTRTVQRWEAGTNTIKTFAVEALLTLENQAAEQVTAHVSALRRSRRPPVLTIEDNSDSNIWPPGWHRMIAFRVRQQVPGLRIVDPTRREHRATTSTVGSEATIGKEKRGT